MVQKIVVDPVSRIEGHLRVDLEIQNGIVQTAYSSGTSFRGLEGVLVGRDPRQASQITQRICGVCPIPHATASSEAFEAAAGITISEQARLLRNLLVAANFIESHLLSFYLLSLPDFVAGLPSAGPWTANTKPRAWAGVALSADRLQQHALESLGIRQACHSLGALFGGRMPHPAGIIPGGATARVSAAQIDQAKSLVGSIQSFVQGAYLEDLEALAKAFPQYRDLGASGADMLSFGGFPDGQGGMLFARGVWLAASGQVVPVQEAEIRESVARASYQANQNQHPLEGTAEPDLSQSNAYTWVKAARLQGNPCEVGPLARALVAGRDPGGRGVWARHLARQWEAATLASLMLQWLEALQPDTSALDKMPEVPDSAAGAGLTEAPRGALGHWLVIEKAAVLRYNVISPTTWNASPRDDQEKPGPLEQALSGLTVADSADPVEALRVVRSFDPCLQCAVH